jgi:hypothetical protein
VKYVTSGCGRAHKLKHEVCVIEELRNQRLLKTLRVDADGFLELAKNSGGIMKGTTIVNLREIDVVVESVGVAEIVVAADHASGAVINYFGDSLKIAIEPVDLEPVNPQPRATVNPRSPLPEIGHLGRGALRLKIAGEPSEKFHRGGLRGPVVDSQIEVRILLRGASCAGSSQGYCDHAFNFAEP